MRIPAISVRLLQRMAVRAGFENDDESRAPQMAPDRKGSTFRSTVLFVFLASVILWLGIFALVVWILGLF